MPYPSDPEDPMGIILACMTPNYLLAFHARGDWQRSTRCGHLVSSEDRLVVTSRQMAPYAMVGGERIAHSPLHTSKRLVLGVPSLHRCPTCKHHNLLLRTGVCSCSRVILPNDPVGLAQHKDVARRAPLLGYSTVVQRYPNLVVICEHCAQEDGIRPTLRWIDPCQVYQLLY